MLVEQRLASGKLLLGDEASRSSGKGIIPNLSQVHCGRAIGSLLSLALLACVLLGRWGSHETIMRATSSAALVQTSSGSGDRLTRKPNVPFGNDFKFQGPVVDVGDVLDGHEITGFGGAFTEASATVYNQMPSDLQEKFIDLYFGEGGINYNLGRVPINSCDFSLSSYSFDDVPGDFELAHFDTSLKRDTNTIIALIHAAKQSVEGTGNKLQLFASPWSPPAWMKGNGAMDGSSKPCLKKDPKYSQVWADYIAKWIEAYEQHGVPIWGITMQNEPEFAAPWEACVFTPEEAASFLTGHLGPTLKSRYPDLQIFAYDHNKDHIYKWAQVLHAQPNASEYLAGVAMHWYTGDHFDIVAKVNRDFPKFKLLATEATWERYRWRPGTNLSSGDWDFGLGYAHDIMGDLNSGSTGWTDWNLLLDDSGGPNHVDNVCDAPLMYDRSTKELYIHPQYWFLGHFSKYLLPGSKRMNTTVSGSKSYSGKPRPYGTCTAADGLQATSFRRPDGSIAVVVLNCGSRAINFKLRHAGQAAAVLIPAYAIQTYTL